jgi:hypothetical protein
MGLIDTSIITKIRRNHGLEHATIHILSQRHKNLSIVGHSNWSGFTLYGAVDTAEVEYAANEALRRLQQGQSELAVHPRCGTVLATTGLLTGLAAFFAIGLDGNSRGRFRWASFPAAILAATFAAIVAQPVGLFLQKEYTTSGNPGTLQIKVVSLASGGRVTTHRVETVQ